MRRPTPECPRRSPRHRGSGHRPPRAPGPCLWPRRTSTKICQIRSVQLAVAIDVARRIGLHGGGFTQAENSLVLLVEFCAAVAVIAEPAGAPSGSVTGEDAFAGTGR